MSSKLCPVAIVFTPIFFAANSIPRLRNGPQIEQEVILRFNKTIEAINAQDEKVIEDTRNSVSELCAAFPIYEKSDIDEVPQL